VLEVEQNGHIVAGMRGNIDFRASLMQTKAKIEQ